MLVQSGVLDDARIRREVETLAAAGYRITVVGNQPPRHAHAPLPADVLFVSEGVSGRLRPQTMWMRTVRWLLLPEYRVHRQRQFRRAVIERARLIDFDVVHCHDYPTLAAGLALAGDRPVVYDSHECWYGRLRHGRPEPVRRFRQLRSERRLARRCEAVITVSRDLEKWIVDHLAPRETVLVQNSFPPPVPPPAVPDRPTGIVYAGRIAAGRDLETAFATAFPPGIGLTLAGPVEEGFSIPTGVRYEGVMEIDGIPAVLAAHGLALISLEDSCLNHRLALPNKVFQAVASGIPVVAADLPALRRLVTEHGIGTLYRPGNPESLAAATTEAVDRYDELKERVMAARTALSWDRDAIRLESVYRGLRR
jgi:glycosyltransferase involved in cell wall biosynthesis